MKKFASLILAGTLSLSLAAPALAANEGIMLISAKLPSITVNGVALDMTKLPVADGIPLRAFVEADGGSAEWYPDENLSLFFTDDGSIQVKYETGTAEVAGETFEGATAVDGVTFVPFAVVDAMTDVEVKEENGDYIITTSSSNPLVKLAKNIQETTEMGRGMKQSGAQLEEFFGIKAANFESMVAYMPMMINADTVVIGKVADGKMKDAKADLQARQEATIKSFEQYLPGPLEMAKNGKVVSSGDYVMLIISPDTDTAIELFNAAVKDFK